VAVARGAPAKVSNWPNGSRRPPVTARLVLEIPTTRSTTHDQVRFAVKMGKDLPMKQQQRPRTSPIWHSPAS
jgi:hypothetical protein